MKTIRVVAAITKAINENGEPIIVIDAGHGGEDGGACTYGEIPEKELNLFIAQDLSDMLPEVSKYADK